MKILLLTIVSSLTILLLLNLGYYKPWFSEKPLDYWKDFRKESASHASLKAIRQARYGLAYSISMRIKETVENKKINDPVILFEPNGYYNDSLHMDLHVPEPAVFYYYTGLHSVWMNSPGVGKANYLVRITKGEVKMDHIRSAAQLQQILARYQSYTINL